jgi:hypothetical protein
MDNNAVQLARLVRTRQLRIEDVPAEQRQNVAIIARQLTDANLAQLAPQRRWTSRMGRSFVRDRNALS